MFGTPRLRRSADTPIRTHLLAHAQTECPSALLGYVMPVRVPSMAVFSASSLLKFTRGCSRCLVTTQEINAFQDKGAICLRGVFRDWVENLKRGIAANHKNPSEMSEWLQSEVSETFYFNDFFNWRKIPEFEEFVFKSPAAEIAGKLMKSEVTSSIVVYN